MNNCVIKLNNSPSYLLFLQPRKVGLLEMKPCNDVEETEAQGFTDELTVLANMVGSLVHYFVMAITLCY